MNELYSSDIFVNEEEVRGNPIKLEQYFQREIANQILKMGSNDSENVINNMRLTADIFELLEEYINEDFIVLKYNPMGSWYKEDIEY